MMLEAINIGVRLGGKAILDGVSLALAPGALIGLIGPNGAGKTTLLRALAGLLPASSGEVRCDGRPLTAYRPEQRARRIAYLAQNGATHWPLSVEHLVRLGRLPHRRAWRGADPRDDAVVARMLAATDIAALRERRVGTLSGGEKLRALLARALAVEAPFLLVDEPVAALDPYHQLEIMELLRATAGRGTAVAAILHDLTLAARFCDRLVLLGAGRVLAEGEPDQVLTEAKLADAFRVATLQGAHQGGRYVLPWSRLPGGA
jgi:iron complex transport system ATP-binding protein